MGALLTMPFDRLASRSLTIVHEGCRRHVYPDSKGLLTVGIGCYLARGGVPGLFASLGIDFSAVRSGAVDMTDAQVQAVFDHDLDVAIGNARIQCPTFDAIPSPAQLCLVDMAFQMGGAGLGKFPKMLGAIKLGDWATAAAEMIDSDWHTETKGRCEADAALMRSCSLLDAEATAALLARAQECQIDLVAELDLLRPTGLDRDG
jgi:GH24 family phage-related lysozyme (muramidase)